MILMSFILPFQCRDRLKSQIMMSEVDPRTKRNKYNDCRPITSVFRKRKDPAKDIYNNNFKILFGLHVSLGTKIFHVLMG